MKRLRQKKCFPGALLSTCNSSPGRGFSAGVASTDKSISNRKAWRAKPRMKAIDLARSPGWQSPGPHNAGALLGKNLGTGNSMPVRKTFCRRTACFEVKKVSFKRSNELKVWTFAGPCAGTQATRPNGCTRSDVRLCCEASLSIFAKPQCACLDVHLLVEAGIRICILSAHCTAHSCLHWPGHART